MEEKGVKGGTHVTRIAHFQGVPAAKGLSIREDAVGRGKYETTITGQPRRHGLSAKTVCLSLCQVFACLSAKTV